jgi:hypothetical protein
MAKISTPFRVIVAALVGSVEVRRSAFRRVAPGVYPVAAIGMLPGVEIVLVQRAPALVFRMGHAEFAVGRGVGGARARAARVEH